MVENSEALINKNT